jgi:hypothetical protein
MTTNDNGDGSGEGKDEALHVWQPYSECTGNYKNDENELKDTEVEARGGSGGQEETEGDREDDNSYSIAGLMIASL